VRPASSPASSQIQPKSSLRGIATSRPQANA
jgi:hypothetical protein